MSNVRKAIGEFQAAMLESTGSHAFADGFFGQLVAEMLENRSEKEQKILIESLENVKKIYAKKD